MQNFIVSCPSLSRRLDRSLTALKNIQIHPEVWIGYDKWLICSSEGQKVLNEAKTACFLSHYSLWQHLFASNIDKAMIFEDDINLQDASQSLSDEPGATKTSEIASYWSATPEDWDLVYCGHCYLDTADASRLNGKVVQGGRPQCTHAYALNRKALSLLLQFVPPINQPLDLAMQKVHRKLMTYAWAPSPFGQDSEDGLIASSLKDY